MLIGRPENEPMAKITFSLMIQDLEITIERPVVYKMTDPVKGEIYRPLEVLPPVTIQLPEKVFVFSDQSSKSVFITIRSNQANTSGELFLQSPEGWTITLPANSFSLGAKGQEVTLEATITPGSAAKPGTLHASVMINGASYHQSISRIDYDHIPAQFILTEANASLVPLDLKKAGTEIAYIQGAGDDVATCLKQTGYQVTILTNELLAAQDLSKYSAVVMGIRAYNTNDRLQLYYDKLMDYVKKGGNLVVQYNTNSRFGPLQAKMGPYPFSISRDRVTDEKAEVKFINESHPALNFPNKITKKDFEGWVQERGIYFANEVDKNYETILSMRDQGEKESTGSLIIGKYGAGNFVYTGLVFFRELPAGVGGAYRLFINLLSLPKNNQQ